MVDWERPRLNAEHKVLEARHFLDKLQVSKTGRLQEFSFNLSAFVVALRSVTYVLQKDIGGNTGAHFGWYRCKVDALRESLPHAAFFLHLRTVVQKEGDLTDFEFVLSSTDGNGDSLTMRFDPVRHRFTVSEFTPGSPIHIALDSTGLGEDDIRQLVEEQTMAAVTPRIDHADWSVVDTRVILGSEATLSMDEFLAACGIHVDALTSLVDEALRLLHPAGGG